MSYVPPPRPVHTGPERALWAACRKHDYLFYRIGGQYHIHGPGHGKPLTVISDVHDALDLIANAHTGNLPQCDGDPEFETLVKACLAHTQKAKKSR